MLDVALHQQAEADRVEGGDQRLLGRGQAVLRHLLRVGPGVGEPVQAPGPAGADLGHDPVGVAHRRLGIGRRPQHLVERQQHRCALVVRPRRREADAAA
jgi:hypothetical protein